MAGLNREIVKIRVKRNIISDIIFYHWVKYALFCCYINDVDELRAMVLR